ncbi:MAG: acyl-CoA dehydrogenase, partial [Alphaproteobacteria bacterium]|nr:acyl-CoA dehydrogenase [Alphaproteobacteria bacterium]
MMAGFSFEPVALPPEAEALRQRVRALIAAELAARPRALKAWSWAGFDADFSRKLGAAGFLGLTWPKKFGGHERTALDRFVVVEELLAAGAPVHAHWIAERQSGPLVLRFGTEAQRQRYLPPIVRGESYFCIGMSEPDSGSDLASIRTRAMRDGDFWRLDGRKVWTSFAHKAHHMIALVRTAPGGEDRHAGLSQFLVDLAAPGITIRPIRNMAGDSDFNEVTFDGVALPADALLGGEGQGWQQVLAELAFERSGLERILSAHAVLVELIRHLGGDPSERAAVALGRAVAQLATLRQMSLAVAGRLAAGEAPVLEAAMV